MFVEIDRAHSVQAFFGYAELKTGALAEVTFRHDPGWEASRRVSEQFFSVIREEYGRTPAVDEANALAIVRAAACRCVDAIKREASRGPGSLSFSVVMEVESGFTVLNLGSNMVLHVTRGEARLVIEPHSVMMLAIAKGVRREKAADFAGASSVVVAEGVDYSGQIRVNHISLGEEDWLLVVPGSEATYDLTLEKQPKGLDELAAIIDVLAKPYVQYSRSWLAVGPRDGH